MIVKLHPGDVVSYTLDLPARQRGAEHGQVCLPTGAGEGCCHVLLLPGRVRDAEDLNRRKIRVGKNGYLVVGSFGWMGDVNLFIN